jgi:hypothetical protein
MGVCPTTNGKKGHMIVFADLLRIIFTAMGVVCILAGVAVGVVALDMWYKGDEDKSYDYGVLCTLLMVFMGVTILRVVW